MISRTALFVLAVLMPLQAAAQGFPIAPLPPRGVADSVGVRMGNLTFLVPKDLYATPTSPRAEQQFALILSLLPLSGAKTSGDKTGDEPPELTVSVLHDPIGRGRRAEGRELPEFVDGASVRADADGFFHYPNSGGERVETHDDQGQLFALQCSAGAEPACRRDAWYAPNIRLIYRYPRPYLSRALDIEAGLFRVLDQLKSN